MEGIKSLNPDTTLDRLNPALQLHKGLPPYLLSMNEVDRETNLHIIQSMNKKITFLKNPRTVPPRGKGTFSKMAETSPFRAEPAEILFTNYEAGGVYEMDVKLTNVAEVLRRVIFLPPATPHFSIGNVLFPSSSSGFIAPGMSAIISVHFQAESLADFDDELVIKTEQNPFVIPLRARREPPSLSLADSMDCGTAWVGDRADKVFHVFNTGGSGGFKFFHEFEDQDPGPGAEILTTEPFTIFPLEFYLQKGETVDVFISFQPKNEGQFSSKVILACDNHTSSFYTVQGIGAMVDFSLSKLDGKELDPAAEPISGLWFQEVHPGDVKERVLEVQNRSSIQVQFHWSLYPRETKGLVFDTPPVHFSITPSQGIFGPGEALPFKVQFSPDSAQPFDEFMDLFVEGVPWTAVKQLPESLLKSLQENEGSSALVGSNSKFPPIPYKQVQLHGLGATAKVSFSDPFHIAQVEIPIGTSYMLETRLRNSSLGSVNVRFQYCDELSTPGLLAKSTFSEGQLPVNGEVEIGFDILSTTFGLNEGVFRCDVEHGRPVFFRFQGRVTGPKVRIGESEIDFGLIRTLDEAKFRLHIENLSSIPAPIFFTKPGQDELSDPRLRVDPPSKVLQPHEQSSVMITFVSKDVQSVLETLMCVVSNGQPEYVLLRAEVQMPLVALSRYAVELGEIAAGVPRSFDDLFLINFGNLPTQYQWEEIADAEISVMFDPARGVVPPRSRQPIKTIIRSLKGGAMSRIFLCNVDGLELPLGIEVDAEVKGLDVTYGVADDAVLSRVASKRVLESSLPPSLYTESDRKKYSSTLLSPTQEFTTLKSLDFGTVHINEVRVVKFLIKNSSGLQTHFELRSESYEPGISQEEAEERRVVKEAQATQFSTGSKVKFTFAAKPAVVKDEKLPQLLTNAHERLNKFSSQNGATFTNTRNLEKNQRFYLANNKGLALVCSPNKGELLPYSEVVVSVSLYNDVCGKFEDVIVSSVSGLKEHKIPVRVRVKGSPLVFAPHQLGVDYKTDPFELDFGTYAVGGNAITRKIRLTNTGPKDIALKWKLFNYQDILHNSADVFQVSLLPSALARFYEGEEHNLLELRFTALEPPEHSDPFSIQPREMLLHGRESGSFLITFFSNETNIHKGVLMAQPVLQEEDGHQQLGELALGLKAEMIVPSLYIDKMKRPDGMKSLKFEVWANGGPPGVRDFTLCNTTSATLQFSIRVESGPFSIKKVHNSASLSLQEPEEEKTITKKLGTKVQDKHTLAPRDNLQVYIQFLKPNPTDFDAWPDLSISSLRGVFQITYSNGHSEQVNLEAQLLRPQLSLWSSQVDEFSQLQEQDFGVVTVDRYRKVVLYLSNLTPVDAKWNLVYVKAQGKVNFGAKTVTKKEQENLTAKDDQEVFQFSVSEGMLLGPSTPVRRCFPGSAFPYIPTQRDPAAIQVSFQPKLDVLYKSRFRVMVEGGPSADVVFKGRGTYREETDL